MHSIALSHKNLTTKDAKGTKKKYIEIFVSLAAFVVHPLYGDT